MYRDGLSKHGRGKRELNDKEIAFAQFCRYWSPSSGWTAEELRGVADKCGQKRPTKPAAIRLAHDCTDEFPSEYFANETLVLAQFR